MDEMIVVMVSCASPAEAEAIGRAAVEARLAACASTSGPVQSQYWWQGSVETAAEYVLTLKTVARLFDELARAVRERHSYENPEIIALPAAAVAPAYRDWLAANVRSTR